LSFVNKEVIACLQSLVKYDIERLIVLIDHDRTMLLI